MCACPDKQGYFHEINNNIPLWFYSMFFCYTKIYIHINLCKTHIEVAMFFLPVMGGFDS